MSFQFDYFSIEFELVDEEDVVENEGLEEEDRDNIPQNQGPLGVVSKEKNIQSIKRRIPEKVSY